ncbi:MAG: DUF5916 domain-containing protein [Bacteroidales bacterium]
MKKYRLLFAIVLSLFFISETIYAQRNFNIFSSDSSTIPKKQMQAKKIEGEISVDGKLSEPEWQEAPASGNFFTYSPSIGKPSDYNTKVKVLYNNQAIYFGAFLKDNPDSILTALSKRDEENVNADKFWVTLNPHNDGKNIFQFVVTAANVQSDIKISPQSEGGGHGWPGDSDWDAVWESEVRVVDSGWVVEMRIPYDAIRFPNKEVQTWGVNFWRTVRRERKTSSWSMVDRTKENEGTQYGELTNIHGIEPPLRLSLFPYVSGYVHPHDGKMDYEYSAGLDLKYGIDESFTLDMILVPDFGQKKSDETVLNLSPYEVQYSEKRQFFKEGTDLFNKAGLFYSRRIGDEPDGYNEVNDKLREGEEVVDNPEEANLINATKISGRTKKGLGLGFFNAETGNTHATVKDSLGNTRKIRTQPFTNYNLMVVDKNIGKHSYANIINTNYYQPSSGKLENVTGTAFKAAEKNNDYATWGTAAHSLRKDSTSGKMITGQNIDAKIGKISGDFKFNYRLKLLTDEYDHNALGYLQRNNEFSHYLSFDYGIYEPQGNIIDWNNSINFEYNSLYSPREFTDFNINASSRLTLKNYLFIGSNLSYRPTKMNDYFEPRVEGRVFERPEAFEVTSWLSSDYRKPLALDLRIGYNKEFSDGYFYSISPRIRIGNKFLVVYEFRHDKKNNEKGFVNVNRTGNNDIIFGRRDNTTYTNSINSSFIFNNKSWISLALRHYWSQIDYDKYYTLKQNGGLSDYPEYNENEDFNYNIFNIDLMYSWNFAPGSFLTLVWKNNILEREYITENNFYSFDENLENMLNSNKMQNSFSIKISYYLDYKYLLKTRGK